MTTPRILEETATCPACRRSVRLNDNGTFRRHRGGDDFDQATDGVCSWSNLHPEEAP